MLTKEKNAKNPFSRDCSFEKGFFSSHGTYIHPTSIIGKNVQLGENVKIGPFCLITGNVQIDSGTRLHMNISVGMPAQDTLTHKTFGSVEIGKNCEIREFVTIGSPKQATPAAQSEGSNPKTVVGDNCYIMNFSHVAHDVVLENNVVMINNVNLAGHVHVGHHTMLMANTAIHQYCKVGAYGALAPFSGMRQDLPPFCLFNGTPGRFAGLNLVALRRAQIPSREINAIKSITSLFFQKKLLIEEIVQIVEQREDLKNSRYVGEFLEFVKNSSRGISRKTTRD